MNTENRELEIRASVDEARTVSGVGVPYGEIISIWGQREMFAPGSVRADGAKLLYRHAEPIGVVLSAKDDKTGWHPTAKISATARGDEAYQLARDGVLDGLSAGFQPVKWHTERDDQGEYVVYDEAIVREVSLVAFPAYPSAQVTDVRHAPTTISTTDREDHPMTDENTDREGDLRELRESVQDVQRSLTVLQDRGIQPAEPVTDTRSAGEWVRGLAAGEPDMIREYNEMVQRAYSGGTTADGITTPQYVGDTIRLVNVPDTLAQIFSTGVLPAKGLKLEYGVLESNTLDVTEQVLEGNDLTTGKLAADVDYADIKTYGGTFGLSRQAIERTTNVNLLDLHHRGLALAAAKRKAAVLRAHYAAAVTASVTAGNTVDVADEDTYLDWVGSIVDAAELMIELGLSLDALIVDKSKFLTLAGLQDTSGRPLMRISGTGVNTVGEIAPKALGGDLASVAVRVNLKQAAPGAAFVNGEAIRQYNGAVTELADETITNLTKEFGLYYYAALATEIPAAIIPVEFGA